MMWIDGGVLYTDRPRTTERPVERTPHKAGEWKADWWLGREVTLRNGDKATVVAADHIGGKPALVLTSATPLKVLLTTANTSLLKGDWRLV